MGKNAVPVVIIIASLGAGLSWKFVPGVRSGAASAMDAARRCFATVSEKSQQTFGPAKVTEQEMADIQNVIRDLDAAEDAAVVNAAYKNGERKLPPPTPSNRPPRAAAPARPATAPAATVVAVVKPQPAPAPVPAAKPQPAAPARPVAATKWPQETPPSARGIARVPAGDAKWGVLAKVTPVQTLDGKSIGSVKGGRFFLIESVDESGPNEVYLVGNFTPKKMSETVQVPANNLFCFTGSPDSLSETQQQCLREFYELRGAAEEYRERLLREASEKSPYFKEAAAALEALRAKAKTLTRNTAASDANRKATYEIAQLKLRVQEANAKHREWKEKHLADFDPSKDPVYKAFLEKQRDYLAPISEIAFR